jgi:hypothetical protein
MTTVLQTRVEDKGLVVSLVSQLEESAVGVYGIAQVGPQWQMFGRESYIPLD